MTDAQWSRLRDIVPEALALPPDERQAYLDEACTSPDGELDQNLRDEAGALVDAAEAAESSGALTSPLAGLAADAATAGTAPLPERLGPWRVTGLLGEGGMGVVYRAERADGLYERTVAVKRIRPLLGASLAGRLEAEQQVLARLGHDGIARMYDAGVADDGAPYVVMELAEGAPITDYADDAALTVRDRVALFVQVCDAVAYAHRHLVVHRDLKPSNVFVAAGAGGTPAVKLLDFGIAKLLDPALDGLFGQAGAPSFAETLTRTQAAMTPSYAAPEQLTRGDVTTATDVYALGVMLYELLAGRRPYSLAGLTPAEAERIVCRDTHPAPSGVAPASRARDIRGDLDTIVEKALAKEPDRRYASAEALATDLRRHLDGLPVLARRPSAAYRVGRFVRRHRAGVAAAAVVVLALVGGLAAATWQAGVARAEAARAEALNTFLVGLLGAASPEGDGRDVRVADLLDQAAAALDTSFSGQPDVEAQARHTLGVTYRELGLYDAAIVQLRRALSLRERYHGRRHEDVSSTQYDLAATYRHLGNYTAAESLLTIALATDRDLFGERNRRVSFILNDMGVIRYELGDITGAVEHYRASLAIDESLYPPDHPDILIGMGNVAAALADQGETDEAAAMYERNLAVLRRERPDDHERIGHALANLGSIRHGQGRDEEALLLHRESVQHFRTALGEDHDFVAWGLSNVASTLAAVGQHEEAEALARQAVAIRREAVGETHPTVAYPMVNLARALIGQGRFDEAGPVLAEALALAREGFGADHPAVARALTVAGDLGIAAGDPVAAERAYREAMEIRAATLPARHPERAVAASMLGDALRRMGRLDEAEPLLEGAYRQLSRSRPRDPATAASAARLADYYQAAGQPERAAALRSGS